MTSSPENNDSSSRSRSVSPERLNAFARKRLEWLVDWDATNKSVRDNREGSLMEFVRRFAEEDKRTLKCGEPFFSDTELREMWKKQKITRKIRDQLTVLFTQMLEDGSSDIESERGKEEMEEGRAEAGRSPALRLVVNSDVVEGENEGSANRSPALRLVVSNE